MINIKKLDSYLKNNAKIIDIRSPIDYRNSHIENSINLPLLNFCNLLPKINPKENIILICVNKTDKDVTQALNYAEMFKITKIMPVEYSDYLKLSAKS